jgi:hypothetical protein
LEGSSAVNPGIYGSSGDIKNPKEYAQFPVLRKNL